jgi:hypothetical protein
MPAASRFRTIAATAAVSLLLGLAVGFAVGSVVMRNTVWGLSRPAFVSSGAQAHTVLVLLQSGQADRLTALMEDEVDRTLSYLGSVEPQPSTGSPEWQVYQRLKSYRASHPRAASAAPKPRAG